MCTLSESGICVLLGNWLFKVQISKLLQQRLSDSLTLSCSGLLVFGSPMPSFRREPSLRPGLCRSLLHTVNPPADLWEHWGCTEHFGKLGSSRKLCTALRPDPEFPEVSGTHPTDLPGQVSLGQDVSQWVTCMETTPPSRSSWQDQLLFFCCYYLLMARIQKETNSLSGSSWVCDSTF